MILWLVSTTLFQNINTELNKQLRFPLSPYSASPAQSAPQSAWSSSSGCECVCWALRWTQSPRPALYGHCHEPWKQKSPCLSTLMTFCVWLNDIRTHTHKMYLAITWRGRCICISTTLALWYFQTTCHLSPRKTGRRSNLRLSHP